MAVKKAKYKRKNVQGQYDTYHFETETAQVLGLTDFVKSLGYVHPNSGATAGTYKSVSVSAQGHVTTGTNPTTLAGYGITDAAAKSHGNHVPNLETANNSRFLRNDDTWQTVTPAGIGAAAATHMHDDRYYTESEIVSLLAVKAALASPALSGVPTAPTAATATNSTQIATTAFVKAVATAANCGGIVGGSLAQNGWVKFANGLILQWGSVPVIPAWGVNYINYSIAFKINPLGVVAIAGATQYNNPNYAGINVEGAGNRLTGFSIVNSSTTIATLGGTWVAIGC